MLRRFLLWLIFDGPYLGPLAPWLFGLAIGRRPHEKPEDPMGNHKCRPVAKVTNMGPGREWWMGELLEPIPGHEEETHCLHITTPYKSVVWGVNLGDMMAYAVLAHIVHKELVKDFDGPINPNWLDAMERNYRKAAEEDESL